MFTTITFVVQVMLALGWAIALALGCVAEEVTFKVISRGEAAGAYQAFPDVCRLKDGDLLCVFYAGYQHVSLPKEGWPRGGRICMVRSKDEGKTWSEPAVLFDGPMDDRDPSVAQMSDRTVLCTFFTRTADGKCKVCLVSSRDGGKNWDQEPRVLLADWATSSPVRELADKTRVLGVYREDQDGAWGGVIRSSDGGKTWSEPIPIGKGSGVKLDAETDIVQLKDGSLYAALRSQTKSMYFAMSADAGVSWSEVKPLGFAGHCPHFTRLSSGEIILSHRHPQTAVHMSRDEAKTWAGPYAIDNTIGAYPSTVELKDGSVLIVYYEEGVSSAIRMRKFRVKEKGIEMLGVRGE